ncbi:site-specific integrase [Granulosicoccus sp.]|nr:site-specific integrase [Granulosicoccus sp.]
MLENYYTKPATLDRIQDCWLGKSIEQYVSWLAENKYSRSSVQRRIPVLMHFAEYSWKQGARTAADLPALVDAFVGNWIATRRRKGRTKDAKRSIAAVARVPVEQLLTLLIPEFDGHRRSRLELPFNDTAPGFIDYLNLERGLSKASIVVYTHNIRRFEKYLEKICLSDLQTLTPAVLSAYITDCSQSLGKNAISGACTQLRVFLKFLYREDFQSTDLSSSVDCPRLYRLSSVPRSISWEDVQKLLDSVDQRSAVGKRDYAMLMLLVTYGLRAREVATMTLDDIDWTHERLSIPDRKAAHNTAFPLTEAVGEAIVEYLCHSRPESDERAVFLCAVAPFKAVDYSVISVRTAHCLRKAGIAVSRAGSHTLRHTCVRRLVNSKIPLKAIGDFIGHRSPKSTEIYTKIDIEGLREVAMGDGEEVK